MAKRLLTEVMVPDQYPVRLYQTGPNQFLVEYGEGVKIGTRVESAKEFGLSVFHALECEGMIDPPKV